MVDHNFKGSSQVRLEKRRYIDHTLVWYLNLSLTVMDSE